MFSSAVRESGPAKGTRSSRRRLRPAADDSLVQQPKAKRQRVPLSQTTFVNPDVPTETFEVKSDNLDIHEVKRDGLEKVAAPKKELSVRSKKQKAGERTAKGDGSVVLTTNNAYTVSKLPALPDRLRADSQNRQHGAFYSTTGYALSLTHTHALVWPYSSTASSPETFTFALPYPSRHASDPLPLGALVAPSASSEEPGLVVVMPVSGKVAFWESISSAATLDFIRQQRVGVEDTIHGMFSGEYVVQIVDAESAGFVLAFSSGRLAYLSVRDGHGKPGISVQFLRNGPSTMAGGFLGSIRHALTNTSGRGEITTVKAHQGTRVGERTVVLATSKGKFRSWNLHRGGHHDFLAEVDVRDDIVAAMRQADGTISTSPNDTVEVLDFAFVPRLLEEKFVDMSRLSEALRSDDDRIQHLVLLASMPSSTRQNRYFIVEIVLSPGSYRVGMLRPLTSYTTPVRRTALEPPRIYLPRPGLLAFVIFDRAIVVASLAAPPDSPDMQLKEDSHIIPATFEDVIDFQDEGVLQVVGSGTEEPTGLVRDDSRAVRHRTKNPAVVVLLQGVGVLRIAAADIDEFASERPPELSAKSKLEQAIFFGIKEDNPIQFLGLRDLPFSSKDICEAAVQLSHEILASKTAYLGGLSASLEHNMKTRTMYLNRLITQLNVLKVDMDKRTRWILLYNAEKMVVATSIWQQNEKFLSQRPKQNKKNLITETVAFIYGQGQQGVDTKPTGGEVDLVRNWFVNDVWRLDLFIAWIYQHIKHTYTQRRADEVGLNRLLYEAVTVTNRALIKAREFRESCGPNYGLRSTDIPVGDDMPEPWTGSHYITNNLKRLIEFCYQWLDTHYLADADRAQPAVDQDLLEVVRMTLPSLTGQYFNSLREYAEWAGPSKEPRVLEISKVCRDVLLHREDKILKLKDYDLWDEAIALAKSCRSFHAMARLLVDQLEALRQNMVLRAVGPHQLQEAEAAIEAKEARLGKYFDEFGLPFANATYEVLLTTCGIQSVLDFQHDSHGYVTQFLRTRPELAKISWINDVDREEDIDHAAESLLDLGLSREQQVWSKKIELSLGKLALLAEESHSSAPVKGHGRTDSSDKEIKLGADLAKVERELGIIRIQDSLYSQILPSCQDAVDGSAELEMALKEHARLVPKRQKGLRQLLESSMERLLRHEALDPCSLIDLLTLVYLDPKHHDIIGYQFNLALEVADLGLNGEELNNARRLIWRRCFIHDDWKRVNETSMKDDLDQLAVIGDTAVYHTLFSIAAEVGIERDSYPLIKPSEALGVYIDSLDRRFDNMDDSTRALLQDAMRWEDNRLHGFMEKYRLQEWYLSTLEAAKNTANRRLMEINGADE